MKLTDQQQEKAFFIWAYTHPIQFGFLLIMIFFNLGVVFMSIVYYISIWQLPGLTLARYLGFMVILLGVHIFFVIRWIKNKAKELWQEEQK